MTGVALRHVLDLQIARHVTAAAWTDTSRIHVYKTVYLCNTSGVCRYVQCALLPPSIEVRQVPAVSAVGELFVVRDSSVSFSRASSRSPWHDSKTLVMICNHVHSQKLLPGRFAAPPRQRKQRCVYEVHIKILESSCRRIAGADHSSSDKHLLVHIRKQGLQSMPHRPEMTGCIKTVGSQLTAVPFA